MSGRADMGNAIDTLSIQYHVLGFVVVELEVKLGFSTLLGKRKDRELPRTIGLSDRTFRGDELGLADPFFLDS